MKIRAYEQRNKTSKEMLKELEDLKQELMQLQVQKATGAAAAKMAKIKVIRKNIARLLTVYNQKIRGEAREKYSGKKYVPLDLRPKKTRAIRRALTKKQKALVTQKEKTRAQNFPQRSYALKA
ncbi:unnamed protein product [Amoebophrya sp. A120]|nr:unnamed protein product [Amoebophrya sp. A120]|eukprot:GSA120T00005503001.1